MAQAALEHIDEPVDLVRPAREVTYSMSRVLAVDDRNPPEPPTKLERPRVRGEPAVLLDDGERPAYEGPLSSFVRVVRRRRQICLGSMIGRRGWLIEDGNEGRADDTTPDW